VSGASVPGAIIIIKQIRDCFYSFYKIFRGRRPFPAFRYTGQKGRLFERNRKIKARKENFQLPQFRLNTLKNAKKGFFTGISPAQSSM
jgi:hypothetical protein